MISDTKGTFLPIRLSDKAAMLAAKQLKVTPLNHVTTTAPDIILTCGCCSFAFAVCRAKYGLYIVESHANDSRRDLEADEITKVNFKL